MDYARQVMRTKYNNDDVVTTFKIGIPFSRLPHELPTATNQLHSYTRTDVSCYHDVLLYCVTWICVFSVYMQTYFIVQMKSVRNVAPRKFQSLLSILLTIKLLNHEKFSHTKEPHSLSYSTPSPPNIGK